MKIKEALTIAKEFGFLWVAVDSSMEGDIERDIFAYMTEPTRGSRFWRAGVAGSAVRYIGKYTGSLPWQESKTKVI